MKAFYPGQLARNVKDEDEDEKENDNMLSFLQGYRLFFAPVADFVDEPEIVIVPDRSLHKVPFAALKDETGTYLSETYRIRIVPSLTTLKLIQDSQADYHSQTYHRTFAKRLLLHWVQLSEYDTLYLLIF